MNTSADAITPRDRKLILAGCVLVARTDTGLGPPERAELERLCAAWFPEEEPTLLAEKLARHELSAEDVVNGLSGAAARDTLWMCLTSIAAVDAQLPASEQAVIDRFATLLGRAPSTSSRGSSGATGTNGAAGPGPTRKAGESTEEQAERTVLWFSVYAAVIGAVPQPILSDFTLILPAQVWMLRRIAEHYRVAFDRQMVAELAGIAALSAGTETLRRAFLRLVPVIPQPVTEAASQFAVTYALGKLAIAYFRAGRKVDLTALRSVYDEARRRGSEIYSRFASAFAGRTEKDIDGIVGDIFKPSP